MKRFLTAFAIAILFAGFLGGCGSSGGGANDPGDVADTTPPGIKYTVPIDGAVNVALNRNITVTFSKEMDPTSIGSTTFTVTGPGATPVAGAVTVAVDGTTAIFKPSTNLGVGILYTATVTTGVKDFAGNALESAYTWTFTTGSTIAAGPAPVVLGLAGAHVILAKTGISTTGTTAITGDIGVSPAARTYITGFSETLDSSNQFATSSLVTGKIYAANMAPPTPTRMTTAIDNVETAYTDAAGRTNPAATELGAGNIGGLTIAPGLYKWGTGLTIPTNVTLSGGSSDVWIFQVAEDLTMASATAIILSGGAQAKNIFWQVAGHVTLGTTSVFKGIIMCQTRIEMETGAVLNGRALAQTAVTMDANTVTPPAQ